MSNRIWIDNQTKAEERKERWDEFKPALKRAGLIIAVIPTAVIIIMLSCLGVSSATFAAFGGGDFAALMAIVMFIATFLALIFAFIYGAMRWWEIYGDDY